MPYYLWLASDLTSQHDRAITWELGNPQDLVGAEVVDAEEVQSPHLLRRPVDALRFGTWPGRLFEAEVRTKAAASRDRGGASVRPMHEISAGAVFGPHGERCLAFLNALRGHAWLEGKGAIDDVTAAATEHQARLVPWGWEPLPVRVVRVDDWVVASDMVKRAVRPAGKVGATSAWVTGAAPWAQWAVPWAAWAAWHATHERVERTASIAVWAMARDRWQGPTGWPSPLSEEWRQVAYAVRSSINVATVAPSDDAARAAEYILCPTEGRPDPFESLIRVWTGGYWPLGVVDGAYIIGDVSALAKYATAPDAASSVVK